MYRENPIHRNIVNPIPILNTIAQAWCQERKVVREGREVGRKEERNKRRKHKMRERKVVRNEMAVKKEGREEESKERRNEGCKRKKEELLQKRE